MAVKIRLRRMGSNKKPFFRVVVTDMRRPNEGRFLEALGWYDPKRDGVNCELKLDRVDYWTSKGAILSDTVKSLVKDRKAAAAKAPASSEAAAAGS